MPARVRVTPLGSLVAVPARGLLMGNRGCLHDDHGEVVRDIASYRGWVTCRLSFNGRDRRPLRKPGHYTELFFLDEATALAAGHRPCWTCRRAEVRSFLACMAAGLRCDGPLRPDQADRLLHAERLEGRAFRAGWPAQLQALPDGAMVTAAQQRTRAWLWHGRRLWPWRADGYGPPEAAPAGLDMLLLTPPAAVAALREGYMPIIHDSALAAA
jgi:hypothetical protein